MICGVQHYISRIRLISNECLCPYIPFYLWFYHKKISSIEQESSFFQETILINLNGKFIVNGFRVHACLFAHFFSSSFHFLSFILIAFFANFSRKEMEVMGCLCLCFQEQIRDMLESRISNDTSVNSTIPQQDRSGYVTVRYALPSWKSIFTLYSTML